jgi:hypothetical protein
LSFFKKLSWSPLCALFILHAPTTRTFCFHTRSGNFYNFPVRILIPHTLYSVIGPYTITYFLSHVSNTILSFPIWYSDLYPFVITGFATVLNILICYIMLIIVWVKKDNVYCLQQFPPWSFY